MLPASSVWRTSTWPSVYSPSSNSKLAPSPSTQVSPPSVEYSQVASSSRLPTLTVPSLVIPSPSSPVSSASSGVGASGATMSMVSVKLSLSSETLPAASVAVAVKAKVSSLSAGTSKLQLPAASAVVVPISVPSWSKVTVLPASAVPSRVGVLSLELSPSASAPLGSTSSTAPVMTGVSGAVLFTVTGPSSPLLLMLPASSVWRTSTWPSVYSPSSSSKLSPAPSFQVVPPSVEYSQVAFSSRPPTLTVPSLVILSPSSPVSLASSAVGASGATVSISNSTASEGAELLSASSVITATAL